MLKKLLLLILFYFSIISFSQTKQLSEQAEISILNCGLGNESYSLYGHTALRVKDDSQNLDIVFNYGTFDFSTSNFILKFVKGDLQYFVSAYSYADFEYSYQYEKRSIYEQKLNLTQAQKQELFDKVYNSLYSAEKYYTYKFIDRNCTTMVIDKTNSVLPNNQIESIKPITKTYREVLFPYQKEHFFLNLGINIIFGAKVDQPAEKLFLPFDLIASLEQNEILAQPKETLYEAPKSNFAASIFDSIYTIIIILGLIVLARKNWLTNAYFFLLGIVGLFFCLVGFYSLHEEVLWNYNALLFNPLYLILFYFLIKKQASRINLIAKIIFILHLVYLAIMLNKIHLGIVAPFLVANFLLLFQILRKKAIQRDASTSSA